MVREQDIVDVYRNSQIFKDLRDPSDGFPRAQRRRTNFVYHQTRSNDPRQSDRWRIAGGRGTGGKREIMQMVAPAGAMYQAGTLSGNPLAMAAELRGAGFDSGR